MNIKYIKMATNTIFDFFQPPEFKTFVRNVAWNGMERLDLNIGIQQTVDLTDFWAKFKDTDLYKHNDLYKETNLKFDNTLDEHVLKNRYLDLYIDIVSEENSFLVANLLFQFNPEGKIAELTRFIDTNIQKLKDSIVLASPPREEKNVDSRPSRAKKPILFSASNYVARSMNGVNSNVNVKGNGVKLVRTLTDGRCLLDSIVQAVPIYPHLATNMERINQLRSDIIAEIKLNPNLLNETLELLKDALKESKSKEKMLKNEMPRRQAYKQFLQQFPSAGEFTATTTLEQFTKATITKFKSQKHTHADNIIFPYLERALTRIHPDLKLKSCSGRDTPAIDEMKAHPHTIYVTNEKYFTGTDPNGDSAHYMPFILTV